ncbi:MAG: helix-turn-helix transcriptional regulator [Flexilinea sp.]|nr:helix-turn-helix transcriptional regulator [Flexilinea sp.]
MITDNILKYCSSRNISIRELSRQSGVNYDTLNHRVNPTLKTIAAIMTTLDCKFEDLFEITKQ